MSRITLLTGMLALILASCNPTETLRLNDMDRSTMETGWGEIQLNKSVGGNPLKIAGVEYPAGIGTHAIYKFMVNLDGNGRKFHALVGVDDEAASQASVEFLVLGDREIVWQSGIMKKGDSAVAIDLNIRGIKKLALYVSDGGDNINYDHVDWIDAYFTYVKNPPVPFEPAGSSTYILTPAPAKEPRINGASVIGANPGHPFLFRVPVTGEAPIKLSINKLPAGLRFNAETRVISGKAPAAGDYPIEIIATNGAGESTKMLTLKTGSGLALTPPLGWNSWNCWGLSVDQDKVKAAADAMVQSGLADHGWTYINIDDGWEASDRASSGEILANEKFPDMKELSDYCHNYGLKLGIYSSPGPLTCGGFLGTYQHELQDAKTWSKWGIDYIKYDWCSYGGIAEDQSLAELTKPYKLMRKCLDQVNRDIVFSLCQYGMGKVYEWGEEVGGNLWRTTGDITDTWSSMAGIGFDQAKASPYAGPGHWNDPDMLVVGQVGWGPSLHASKLTADEQYTHISLWSLLASPLLIGCDMTQFDDFTLNLLTNDEVIAINQDPKGEQASPVRQETGIEIWAKNLEDGSKAVGIFFTGIESPVDAFAWDDQPNEKEITLTWEELGIKGNATVRDLWRQTDLGSFDGSFQTTIPFHGVKLLKINEAGQ